MLCAVGRVGNISRKVVVIVVYIPPNTKVRTHEEIVRAVADEIARAHAEYNNPLVVVGGDLKHKDIAGGLADSCVFEEVPSGPTRGPNKLDVLYTNFPESIKESFTIPPLSTNSGIDSDHKCVFVEAAFSTERKFNWEIKWCRKRSKKVDSAFASDLAAWDWTNLKASTSAQEKVDWFEDAIKTLTDKHYPLVRVRKRSNEDPWISHKIRKLWKKKLRQYKKYGKGLAWKLTDSKLQEEIAAAKEAYVERMLESGGSGSSFFAATKKLSSTGAVPPWKVSDLFEDKKPEKVAEEVMSYFGAISGDSVTEMIWERVPGSLGKFDRARVAKILKDSKRTNSTVPGDPYPHLVREFPDAFSDPVADIYNAVNESGM